MTFKVRRNFSNCRLERVKLVSERLEDATCLLSAFVEILIVFWPSHDLHFEVSKVLDNSFEFYNRWTTECCKKGDNFAQQNCMGVSEGLYCHRAMPSLLLWRSQFGWRDWLSSFEVFGVDTSLEVTGLANIEDSGRIMEGRDLQPADMLFQCLSAFRS